MTRTPAPDSREALLGAFARLALSRRYRDFGVAAVAGAAKVARSTFYYHFSAKDDLLLENLRPLIAALAAAALGPSPELERWIAHVWEQRGVAGRLLDGATGRRIEAALTEELRERLEKTPQGALRAAGIAGAQAALLRGWVAGRVSAAPAEMAQALGRAARALAGG